METKVKKVRVQKVVIDNSLSRFKDMNLFPEKSDKFNEMVSRIGEDKFIEITGTQKKMGH
jgi:hypothetical protein